VLSHGLFFYGVNWDFNTINDCCLRIECLSTFNLVTEMAFCIYLEFNTSDSNEVWNPIAQTSYVSETGFNINL
jgi:hypothetical protein